MEVPDATEVTDTFPGRELVVTVEIVVAEEPPLFEPDVELTEPVGLEDSEEMLVPSRSTARTLAKCMSASHCAIIQARMVARGWKSGEQNHRF